MGSILKVVFVSIFLALSLFLLLLLSTHSKSVVKSDFAPGTQKLDLLSLTPTQNQHVMREPKPISSHPNQNIIGIENIHGFFGFGDNLIGMLSVLYLSRKFKIPNVVINVMPDMKKWFMETIVHGLPGPKHPDDVREIRICNLEFHLRNRKITSEEDWNHWVELFKNDKNIWIRLMCNCPVWIFETSHHEWGSIALDLSRELWTKYIRFRHNVQNDIQRFQQTHFDLGIQLRSGDYYACHDAKAQAVLDEKRLERIYELIEKHVPEWKKDHLNIFITYDSPHILQCFQAQNKKRRKDRSDFPTIRWFSYFDIFPSNPEEGRTTKTDEETLTHSALVYEKKEETQATQKAQLHRLLFDYLLLASCPTLILCSWSNFGKMAAFYPYLKQSQPRTLFLFQLEVHFQHLNDYNNMGIEFPVTCYFHRTVHSCLIPKDDALFWKCAKESAAWSERNWVVDKENWEVQLFTVEEEE